MPFSSLPVPLSKGVHREGQAKKSQRLKKPKSSSQGTGRECRKGGMGRIRSSSTNTFFWKCHLHESPQAPQLRAAGAFSETFQPGLSRVISPHPGTPCGISRGCTATNPRETIFNFSKTIALFLSTTTGLAQGNDFVPGNLQFAPDAKEKYSLHIPQSAQIPSPLCSLNLGFHPT